MSGPHECETMSSIVRRTSGPSISSASVLRGVGRDRAHVGLFAGPELGIGQQPVLEAIDSSVDGFPEAHRARGARSPSCRACAASSIAARSSSRVICVYALNHVTPSFGPVADEASGVLRTIHFMHPAHPLLIRPWRYGPVTMMSGPRRSRRSIAARRLISW